MCSVGGWPRCRRRAAPCCLCWCCCCSCSWAKCLAAHAEPRPGDKPRDFATAGPADDAPPSLEEIRSWGQSFDRLMRSPAGRAVFRDFLRGEYSEENIMFWLACEELKRECSPAAVEEKARFIYEDYISILSPKEVSLDSRVRDNVNRSMVEPTPHTFDEAQLQIYTLMGRDSYPRFVVSPLYRALLASSGAAPSDVQSGLQPGVQSGVQASLQSGVQSGVQAGLQSGVQSGVQAGLQSGVQASLQSGVHSGVQSAAQSAAPAAAPPGNESRL